MKRNFFVYFISGIMTLKRKLKRIREGRGSEAEDDTDDTLATEC